MVSTYFEWQLAAVAEDSDRGEWVVALAPAKEVGGGEWVVVPRTGEMMRLGMGAVRERK